MSGRNLKIWEFAGACLRSGGVAAEWDSEKPIPPHRATRFSSHARLLTGASPPDATHAYGTRPRKVYHDEFPALDPFGQAQTFLGRPGLPGGRMAVRTDDEFRSPRIGLSGRPALRATTLFRRETTA